MEYVAPKKRPGRKGKAACLFCGWRPAAAGRNLIRVDAARPVMIPLPYKWGT